MKTTRFFFLMILWAALMHGTSFARPTSQASEPRPSQSRSRTVSVRPSDSNDENQVRGENDQTGSERADQDLNVPARATKAISEHRASGSHPKQLPNHQARSVKVQATKGLRTDAPATAVDPRQTGASKSVPVPNRMLSNRSLLVRAPAVAALSGQEFKNARNPSASLAISGGPANSTRNTAAINGTNMKRKP